MKQITPLRAKILLFSALHYPFDFSEQAWFDLRTYPLLSLMEQMCKEYGNLEPLERQLVSVAQQLQDSQEMLKTAQVIVRSFRRYDYCDGVKGKSR
jgi:hypothetical protein